MAHSEYPISELSETATLRDVITKLNEVIECINAMWNTDEHQE